MLIARNEEVLRELVSEIESAGASAALAVADVADEGAVRAAARTAIDAFGRIDTWVNNAAVSIYGDLVEVPLDEQRRLFDVNYWGCVHGCRVAIEHLRERGGVIVNVGSVLSDRSIPKQGAYCASKHALRGFTDALRMELEEAGLPIALSLIKPSAIDTPYKDHAKNYLERAPKNPPPVYAPEVAAEAILACAESPRRDVVVGGGGAAVSIVGRLLPRLTDLVMERTMSRLQLTDRPAGDRNRHNLFAPGDDGDERGGYPHHVAESSLYTQAMLHPAASMLLLLGIGTAVYAWTRR
jgi:NAD(P)-dependent dehydrogenase (short-subunit alcohol dehydrogenase family)